MTEVAVSLREMATAIAAIDGRTAEMNQKLDSLLSMTARAPDGRTLINLVETILNKVQQ